MANVGRGGLVPLGMTAPASPYEFLFVGIGFQLPTSNVLIPQVDNGESRALPVKVSFEGDWQPNVFNFSTGNRAHPSGA